MRISDWSSDVCSSDLDPDCCIPGSDGCPAKSLEETFGFEWCPGDRELLAHVGTTGYRDPACDLPDAPVSAADPHGGGGDRRQSSCDLAIGRSTDPLGLRQLHWKNVLRGQGGSVQ